MNTFGNHFRVSIFGESHGPGLGITLDGVFPGMALSEEDFRVDIDRRRGGAPGTTSRAEEDLPEIVSGVFEGRTTGAPLTLLFRNKDVRSEDYEQFYTTPRPGHADFAASLKFGGYNDLRGGGAFSGRLTLPLVAAGVVAKKMLEYVVGAQSRGAKTYEAEASVVRLGGFADASQWDAALEKAAADGDSLGAVVECVVKGLPAGLGEPFWDSVESCISHAVFAIPGVRGIEFGDGFASADMQGSEHNDAYGIPPHECRHHHDEEGGEHHCCHHEEEGGEHHCCQHGEKEMEGEHHCCHHEEEEGAEHHCCGRHKVVVPLTNHAGGVNGGITNGNPLVFRVAFKPTSSIAKPQETWNFATRQAETLRIEGRHDVCFALRAPVVVEAVASIVLADLFTRA